MPADSLSIPAESLLEHREFVRRLAKSLVRDEHAAQDVVQETWLEALKRPPQSISDLRAWLARVVRTRAQNAARGEERRAFRERAAAREEVDTSEDRLRERVALQHKVVEAVLGLKEPYRAVVLLHYYEGLSPSVIAARRGAPAGTVRAQLSRAHEILRERLDHEFGGSRAAWCAGLAALSRAGRQGAAHATKLALVGAIGLAAAVPAVLWIVRPAGEATALSPVASNPELAPEQLAAFVHPADPEPIRTPAARTVVPAEPAPPKALPDEELESKSVRQLLQLAIGVQQVLRTKLLTPSESWKERCASVLAMPNAGLARLLRPDRYGTSEANALGLRGAGSCFSFATRKQDWDEEPDLYLDKKSLRCAGWGPGILDLGDGSLEELPTSSEPAPRAMRERDRERWDLLWEDAKSTSSGTGEEFQRKREQIGFPPVRLVEGHVYLVRGISLGAHDVLGAIRLLAEDEDGWTIAWRVLRTWPVRRERGDAMDPYWLVSDPPESLMAMRVDELVDLLHRTRAVARAKLYEAPESVRTWSAEHPEGEGRGVTRLLRRGRYEPLAEARGGGTYFSFATQKSDYDHEPDVCLDAGMYWSGFYGGNRGYLLELGEVPIDSVGDRPDQPPASLPESGRAAWDLLWRITPLDDGPSSRAVSQEDNEDALRLGLARGAGPAVGHSYLLRSILPGEHDVLAVFMTLARDEHGDWIAWRRIWNRKLAKDPKPR